MTEEVLDAEVVDAGTDIVAAPPANLFKGETPAQVLDRARETAEAFRPIVDTHSHSIQGKQHITVEGWLTLGAMLGVTPVCEWTRKLENGWEARVEARTLDGRVVGAAEAECLRDEKRWATADDYAVRSMAQTRATSKALASVLRFVATLAGASGTPAEEMPRDGGTRSWPVSEKQLDLIDRLLTEAKVDGSSRALIRDWATAVLTGGKAGTASKAIDGLMKDKAATAERLLTAAVKWQERQSEVPPDTRDLEPVPNEMPDEPSIEF